MSKQTYFRHFTINSRCLQGTAGYLSLYRILIKRRFQSPRRWTLHFDGDIYNNISGPGIIFVRDFYEKLLADIRLADTFALIVNPGIGKSQFQFYYLAKIVNTGLLGKLTPDINGCTEPPKIVIRQVGKKMIVYGIRNRIAYRTNADSSLLRRFDPKVALYLYERGESKDEPFFINLRLPILATVYPDTRLYRKFLKHDGESKYRQRTHVMNFWM